MFCLVDCFWLCPKVRKLKLSADPCVPISTISSTPYHSYYYYYYYCSTTQLKQLHLESGPQLYQILNWHYFCASYTATPTLALALPPPLHQYITHYFSEPGQTYTMDQITTALEPLKQFSKDSIRLIKRCTKPDRKEFSKIAIATAIGFGLMGFIGFFVKLIHIPINNIIVGA